MLSDEDCRGARLETAKARIAACRGQSTPYSSESSANLQVFGDEGLVERGPVGMKARGPVGMKAHGPVGMAARTPAVREIPTVPSSPSNVAPNGIKLGFAKMLAVLRTYEERVDIVGSATAHPFVYGDFLEAIKFFWEIRTIK